MNAESLSLCYCAGRDWNFTIRHSEFIVESFNPLVGILGAHTRIGHVVVRFTPTRAGGIVACCAGWARQTRRTCSCYTAQCRGSRLPIGSVIRNDADALPGKTWYTMNCTAGTHRARKRACRKCPRRSENSKLCCARLGFYSALAKGVTQYGLSLIHI